MPEDGLLSEPIFLKDRVILKTGIVGWPLGTCVRFRWNGADYQWVMMSRMLDLDDAGGSWESQIEGLGGRWPGVKRIGTVLLASAFAETRRTVPPGFTHGGVGFGDYGRVFGTGFGGFSEGDF